MKQVKNVSIRCEDNAEAIVFSKYQWDDGEVDFEINAEDSYCGGDYIGIKGRFRRAWHAFWAKPVYHSGVYIDGKERVHKFLVDCLKLVDE